MGNFNGAFFDKCIAEATDRVVQTFHERLRRLAPDLLTNMWGGNGSTKSAFSLERASGPSNREQFHFRFRMPALHFRGPSFFDCAVTIASSN
jgi:hypothetical protein